MFSCLISRQSRIGSQFHDRKIRILLNFSWVKDFRKNYQQKLQNNLAGAAVNYVAVQFLRKKNLCCDQDLLCFVGTYLTRSCLVFVAYNKTNIPCLFLFNIEIIHPR